MRYGCGKPPDKHRLVYYSFYAINRNSGRTKSTMQATQSECDSLPLVMAMATDQAARAAQQQGSRYGQGDGNRHNGLLAHNLASQYCGRFSNAGSLAMLMAMRRASSRVIKFAADRRPGSFS